MQELLDENMTPKKSTLQFHWWILLIYFFFFLIGNGFRIMHWPFAAILMIIGAGGFMAYSLTSLILINRKAPLIIISNLISFSWMLFMAWAIVFNHGHPLNEIALLIQLTVFAILFVLHFGILFLIKRYRKKKQAS
jgi:hypothetical protein